MWAVSFFGVGDQDWIELDLDAVERRGTDGLVAALDDNRAAVSAAIGSAFEVDVAADGTVIVVGAARRYRAEVDRSGRLLFTGILDPDGPL